MIWVAGGTKASRGLIAGLLREGFDVVVTTTTGYGAALVDDHLDLEKVVGKLDNTTMPDFIRKHAVSLVIDATHPYAVEVKKTILAVCLKMDVPVIRYEREPLEYGYGTMFENHEAVATYLADKTGPVMLSIGSKNLDQYTKKGSNNIYARVLPLAGSLEACYRAGLRTDKIIAFQALASRSLNKALFEELNIKYLVTKESGRDGGVEEKIAAARELNIEVLIVERPRVAYNEIYYTSDRVESRAREIIDG